MPASSQGIIKPWGPMTRHLVLLVVRVVVFGLVVVVRKTPVVGVRLVVGVVLTRLVVVVAGAESLTLVAGVELVLASALVEPAMAAVVLSVLA